MKPRGFTRTGNTSDRRMFSRRLRRGPALRLGVLLVALFASASAKSTTAADGRWVTPDGRKIALAKSTTELAVQLRNSADLEACGRRLAEADNGKLESFKLSPDARFKMLKTPLASALRRERVGQDPSVVEVRSVYHFEGVDEPVIATGTIAVKVRRGMAEKERQQIWSDFGITLVSPIHGQPDVYIIAAGDDQDEMVLAEALADDKRIAWSQPNFRREIKFHQVSPADEFFSYQWHLSNTGQLGGTVGADIAALDAWAIATGKNVLFGMFDECVDVDHEDLKDNYIGTGQDVSLRPTDPGYSDPRPKHFGERHGTSVMGLAVAKANGRGGRGVAFDAKFTASRGLSNLPSDVQIANAFVFARDQKVDVHINSWGFNGRFPDPTIIVDAIHVAYVTGRNKGDLNGDGKDDPLGMLIFFSSGNSALENIEGFSLAALPEVISVGSSNDDDKRSLASVVIVGVEYIVGSNFGKTLSFLAPSNISESAHATIFTTDNMDSPNAVDKGYNQGGIDVDTGQKDVDPSGSYTGTFGGTSAACPIAAGVAGLILSVNPKLTAADVRMLMEHTADRIDAVAAVYDPVTTHSLKYGYGRVNAKRAVEAAQETLTNSGITWPDRAADVVMDDTSIRWKQNPGTSEFLVVQSDSPFEFVPVDGECYDGAQSGCSSDALHSLPSGVTAIAVGCGLTCDTSAGQCSTGAEKCVPLPQGSKGCAIYARNSMGRYSFGVGLDAAGRANGSGTFIDLSTGGDVIITPGPPASRPAVTINVTPFEGTSPLTVHFKGNATSTVPIDEARTVWDFDINQPPDADAATREATHVYEVPDGQTKTFIARLTMYDTAGTPGSEEVTIRVNGKGFDQGGGGINSGNLQIIVGLPSTPEADTSSGTSPFEVLLSVNTSGLPGTYQSIYWDLGDGTSDTSLVAPHTYTNDGTTDLRIPITATVTTSTSQSTTISTTATRIITVKPGLPPVNGGGAGSCEIPGTCASGPGGSASPCGAGVGMIPVLFTVFTLVGMRRRSD